ncbi:Cell death-regulatory protein GRIM19 [Fasciolopsis buskii]|uniref:NADH dehydrogenase [ubiquinone] 1 alpha subcomplex subunit 13 n=1 Tax=Fasciolopsis buskii TaxID=27845 RepID=A0A8E0RU95_9TREM|nr:Cell death-regulatory protein GRIM19 [Fasciolopsis buski]
MLRRSWFKTRGFCARRDHLVASSSQGLLVIGGLYACTAIGFQYHAYIKKNRADRMREEEEVRIALSPFILAEQERLYLKQIRRNRDYETELMRDVPGWKVGHWHDYPLFHNPRGLWIDPNVDEFYAHTTRRFREKHVGVVHDYI